MAEKNKNAFFKSGSTLNPKFDKRYKKGEDALCVKEKFICALDGVGGWNKPGLDVGEMTKELISRISESYENKDTKTLHDLLD